MKSIVRYIIGFFIHYRKNLLKCLLIASVILLFMIINGKTIASGNGYSLKINGLYGKCDIKSSDCTSETVYRRTFLFVFNEDYCNECWEYYGKYMFEGLTKKKIDGLNYDNTKCRYSGCKNKAIHSDWETRFCSEHIQGTKSCRNPDCNNQIPKSSSKTHCYLHD